MCVGKERSKQMTTKGTKKSKLEIIPKDYGEPLQNASRKRQLSSEVAKAIAEYKKADPGFRLPS